MKFRWKLLRTICIGLLIGTELQYLLLSIPSGCKLGAREELRAIPPLCGKAGP
jgi:hypothetical protein